MPSFPPPPRRSGNTHRDVQQGWISKRPHLQRLAILKVVALFAVAISWWLLGEDPRQPHPQTTEKRIHESAWWPTQGSAARKEYAGSEACARCHASEFLAQQQTSMAHAALKPPLASLDQPGANLKFESGGFTTTIRGGRNGDTYSVSRGGESIESPILWLFGEGVLGQTFILQQGGSYYESQLSFYPAIRGLDITPGHIRAAPRTLGEAFGVKESPADAVQCFSCHTTAATSRWQLEPGRLTPGVGCEACHGPGVKHIAAMERKDEAAGLAAILNPVALRPVDQVDFCGACHRAPLDVPQEKLVAPIDVRFQPYRLAKSRCWSKPDARITCIACHDPHKPLGHDAAQYDKQCLNCHRTKTDISAVKDATAPACPVSASRCTSCHMPRYQVQPMHGSFTDHFIRVVRPGDPFPL